MKSKINILFSICLAFVGFQSYAQVRLDPFYPYSKYTFGIGMGYTQLYGDWANSNTQPVYKINVARNANEWVNLNFDLQRGALNDYQPKNNWTNGLSVYNKFTSISVNGNIALGELFNWPKNFMAKTLYGIYVGAGIGYMSNNITNITLKFKNSDKKLITDYDPGNIKTSSKNFFIPANLGINLHLTRTVMINCNYQLCYALSDYVDGYNFKTPAATNEYNDLYSALTFGLHFYIGNISMTPNKE